MSDGIIYISVLFVMDKFIFLTVSLCVVIILAHVYLRYFYNSKYDYNPEYMTTLESHSKEKNFPFRYFVDETGKVVPLVAVTSFFREDAARLKYEEYVKNGIPIIGITAYKSFPKPIKDGSADDYTGDQKFDYPGKIRDWLCCFCNPGEYGFTVLNNMVDISESDFYDADTDEPIKKKYDVIYSCPDDDKSCPADGWNAVNRNFDLALKCFPIMINDYGLNILVIGRTGCKLEEKFGKRIETVDFLPFHDFQQKLRESRILFVPNVADASPRVVAEAMIKDVPVLMNENIMCGSKYVVNETGELFTDETNVGEALDRILKGNKTPKKWWKNNYSVKSSSLKLQKFVADAYPNMFDDVKEIKFIL
jgi:glycosyltransferase involved in cell wall biosynthesis